MAITVTASAQNTRARIAVAACPSGLQMREMASAVAATLAVLFAQITFRAMALLRRYNY
jgi:hypothetical protein